MKPPLLEEHFEKAMEVGITRVLLHSRYYQRDWDLERAITEPVNKKTPSEHTSYIDVAQEHGISKATYYKRLGEGWTKEKASTTPTQGLGRRRTRIYTDDQLEIANSNGISKQCLDGRLRRDWSLEKAITEPPLEFWQRNTGEKAQVFVSRRQRAPKKTKQEKWAEQYKALENYGKELHCVAYGRSDKRLGSVKKDRLSSKLNREKNISRSQYVNRVTL